MTAFRKTILKNEKNKKYIATTGPIFICYFLWTNQFLRHEVVDGRNKINSNIDLSLSFER